MLIDFDDMVMGPPVQDIWLLLPDYAESSRKELELILEGYEAFGEFDRNSFALIEPLRFMRMIHFLAWSAKQRNDLRFQNTFPDWGGKSFWIKEVEDLRLQARVIGA
jgi:Ser/Thr protein kinase RdoA (MazF antagonist)